MSKALKNKVKLNDTVSVKDFGAVGDGVTDDTAALRAACEAVSAAGGGEVWFPVGRYFVQLLSYNSNSFLYDNVAIVGEKMPSLSSDAKRLEGGAVICGGFYAWGNNVHFRDIGFDFGKDLMDLKYPAYDSTTANRPTSTGTAGWDAFSFVNPVTGSSQARGFVAENVICLLSRPLSYGHAFITEAINGGYIDNVVGVYGVHAVVLKNENMRVGSIAGYMASTDNVIIKSDTYAPCGHITIDQVDVAQYYPNVTPWIAPTVATYGVFINPATASMSGPIQIGKINSYSNGRACLIRGGAGLFANDIQIGQITADGTAASMSIGFGADTCTALRLEIGEMIINGAGVPISYSMPDITYAPECHLHVGVAQLFNATNWAIQASAYGRVTVDFLNIKVAGYAYYNEANAQILVGKQLFSGVVATWNTTPGAAPALSASYADAAGYQGFSVQLENYGVVVRGVVSYLGGGTPTVNATIASFPAWLRPTAAQMLSTVAKTGTTYRSSSMGMTVGGSLTYNEGNTPLPTVGDVISVNCSWQNY